MRFIAGVMTGAGSLIGAFLLWAKANNIVLVTFTQGVKAPDDLSSLEEYEPDEYDY